MNKQDMLKIVELYKIMPTAEIAKMYNLHGQTIRANLKRMGVKLHPKGNRLRLPFEEIKEMYESGMTHRKIAEKYNCIPLEIGRVLRKNGVFGRPPRLNKRTASINDYAFSEITEESAYWAGFLMADGTIIQEGNKYRVALGLAGKDIDHIKKFQKFLGSSHKIAEYSFVNRYGNKQSVASLSISSKQMVEDLARFGVIPHKTSRETAKVLEFNRHFWRGMIDGDGCLSIYKSGLVQIQFCGSETITSQFIDFIKTLFPKSYMKPQKIKRANLWKCSTGNLRAIGIVKELYLDCNIFLDRKMEIAQRMIAMERRPRSPSHTHKEV